jgi:hypothetical protein
MVKITECIDHIIHTLDHIIERIPQMSVSLVDAEHSDQQAMIGVVIPDVSACELPQFIIAEVSCDSRIIIGWSQAHSRMHLTVTATNPDEELPSVKLKLYPF